MYRVLHTADLHFSMKAEKLQEVVRTTDSILSYAVANRPDCIVVGGDILDQYDGKIGADSDCFRAAKKFVHRAADIAPLVIIRGTKSHDKDISGLFDDIRCNHPVHVASDVEMVALMSSGDRDPGQFVYSSDGSWYPGHALQAVFTLVPSLDKAALLGRLGGESIRDGNSQFREAVHDMFAGFGLINSQLSCPTVLVSHGMLTGATFSSGQQAVGEDLEFGLNDLQAAKCDAVMLGHVHKHQAWGNVAYSGSPGRLNFGEQEDKGFLLWTFNEGSVSYQFIPTPARRFVFGDLAEWSGADAVYAEAESLSADCDGAFVRIRYVIPEEERQSVDRDKLESIFSGAASVKIEVQVLPKQRVRAAGISRVDSLADKVVRWGETVDLEIPGNVLDLSAVIEGKDAEELLQEALIAIDGSDGISDQVRGFCTDAQDLDTYQPGLFLDAENGLGADPSAGPSASYISKGV